MRFGMFRAGVVLAAWIGWLSGVRELQAQTSADADSARVAAMKAEGPSASLTILPVRVLGQPNRAVADVLGLILEESGMTQLQAIDSAFDLPADTPWDQAVAPLKTFLEQNRPPSNYVLYAKFLGDPQSGPTEVRWLIVDSAGARIASDRQLPADADFRRTAARKPDPLGCSTLVSERVFATFGWKKGARESSGKFARLWAEKAGVASDEEQARMRTRVAKLKETVKTASLGVYATRMGHTPDSRSAERLSQQLSKKLVCRTVISKSSPDFAIPPTSNQQKRLWDLARGFREHLRSQPPETDYAILAEYLLDPARGVHAVNFVVCDRTGEWVIVDFQNSEQQDFQRVAPKTPEDCERLTCERLEGYLR